LGSIDPRPGLSSLCDRSSLVDMVTRRTMRPGMAGLGAGFVAVLGVLFLHVVSRTFVSTWRLAPGHAKLRRAILRNASPDFIEASRADLDPSSTKPEPLQREVRVTDPRDVNELLKLPNPLKPTEDMILTAIRLDDGTVINNPALSDLRKVRPSNIRPIYFIWKDRTATQTMAPKKYDEIIQRLLNSGPAEMEDLVRSNWQKFDKAFFFRLMELKEDTRDDRLREKITNLNNFALDIIAAANKEMRHTLPEQTQEAREILDAMLEDDRRTLLWPPTPEAYKRLAEKIAKLSVRRQYEDGWFETVLEMCEKYGQRMEIKGDKQLHAMTLVCMQRLVTEWLRNDSLWEETDEGRFIFTLLNLSHAQWKDQLFLWQAPLDTGKLRDELKIISENKVVQLPMGSRLQIYAAKYLQGLHEFMIKKDDMLAEKNAAR